MNRRLHRIMIYTLLSIAAFVSVFPFLWLIVGATNISPDILSGKTTPGHALFDNFVKLTQQVDLVQLFYNSTKIAVISTILTLIVASLAGYGFEIFKSKFSERVFAGLLDQIDLLGQL